MENVLQLIFSGLALGGIYAMIAIGFVTIFKVAGIINFAQGDFAMVAGVAMVFCLALDIPLWAAVIAAILASAMVGMLIHRAVLDRMRHQSATIQIILTIAVSIVLQSLSQLMVGSQPKSVPPFLAGEPIVWLNSAIPKQNLVIMGATVLLLLLLYFFFEKSYIGAALRAVMMSREVSRLLGISARSIATTSFVIGAVVAGVAGAVIAPITLVSYDMGITLGLKGFVAAVFGGLVDVPGAVAGALILGLLESLGAGLISSAYKDAIAFVILILILLFRPHGLFGKHAHRV